MDKRKINEVYINHAASNPCSINVGCSYLTGLPSSTKAEHSPLTMAPTIGMVSLNAMKREQALPEGRIAEIQANIVSRNRISKLSKIQVVSLASHNTNYAFKGSW